MRKPPSLPLVVGWASIVVLLLAMAVIVLVSGDRIERAARSIETDSVPGLIAANTMRSAYAEGFVCVLQLPGGEAAGRRETLAVRISRLDATALAAGDDYARTMRIDPRQDAANFRAVRTTRDRFLLERGEFVRLVEEGRREEARRFLQDRVAPAYDALMRACDVLVAYNNQTGTVFSTRVVATVERVRWTVIALAGLAVAGAAVVVGNMRRRARMVDALRESESKFATAFEASPDAITISRRRDGRIIEANAALLELYGLSKETVIGRTTLEMGLWASPDERDRFIRQLERDGRVRNFLKERIHPGDRKVVALISVEPLRLGGEDCLLAIAHDVTERIEAEQAQARAVAEFRAIFDGAATSIVLLNRDSRVVRWNRAFEQFLGYGPEDLARMSIADFTHPDHVGADLERFRKMMSGELRSHQIEKRYRRKDGATAWGRLTTSVVQAADGSLIYGVGLIEDITEHKRAELALRESESARKRLQEQLVVAQKLEALGQLAGGVAHDFNNMLAVVLLYLDLVKGDPTLSPSIQESLAEVTATAKRAAGLTRQLLLFSRREPAQRQAVEMNALVGNLLKMLGRLVGSHLELRHVPAPQPVWVYADSGMLEQVVMNLVVNARDALPRGGTIVLGLAAVEFDAATAGLNPARQPGRFARLTVQDAGCGMSAATRAHIFEPFFTTKEAGRGTGLGLATVLGIVQQHGGWVEVDSEEGRGSTFAVHLPAHAAEAAATAAGIAQTPLVHRGGETVLVAEDNAQLRTVTARILRQNGYTVLEAASGREAKAMLDARPTGVDLLLTDIVMPGGIFGHELAASLRAQGRRTCVILMSAHNTLVNPTAIEAAGGTYLTKPFDTARLLHVVRTALDGQPDPSGA